MSARVLTHSFVKEQGVSSQMVGTQQASKDADGTFKQVNIYILVECELCSHPRLRFFKFCNTTLRNFENKYRIIYKLTNII